MNSIPQLIPYVDKKMVYATKIQYRQPEFKLHASLGHARNAMSQRDLDIIIALYEATDKGWSLVHGYKPSPFCQDCGQRFEEARTLTQYHMQTRYRMKFQDPRLEKWQKRAICADCLKRVREGY